MPTCDEDGPRIIDLQAAAADRARPFALVARTCARQAHEEWQEALKASVAAQAAARAAMGKPESAFLFDRAVAAHQNVRLAEGVYQRARDAWSHQKNG